MPYIGNQPADRFGSLAYQDLTGVTGSPVKRGFTLNQAVGNEMELEVFVNNVRQEPTVAYTVSGTTLTMTGDVETTDDFYVVFQGKAIGTVTHPSNSALQATTGTFSSSINTGTIKEATGTTTAMTIDSTGRILTPARPAFRGTRAYTTTDFTGSGLDITGYTEDFDIGSAFDASAGTYTVPITGIYQINVTQDGSANFSAATNTFLRLKIDGVLDNTTLIARQDPEGGQSSSSTICQTLSLTANQVLLVNFLTGTDDEVAANFVFSGFLVG